MTSRTSPNATDCWVWAAESFNLISRLWPLLFLLRLRDNPWALLISGTHIMCLCRTPPLWMQGQSRRVPLVVLLREQCLPCHKLTSSSNYLGGTEGKKIISNSFSFPANCPHLLPQSWLDSPFPLSSASTARLSPPHPSPPSPRTSKVITIMN